MMYRLFQVKPTLICITYKMYRDVGRNGHTLEKLDSGNYTFRLRATSLAGNGSWTEAMTFNIPDIEGEPLLFSRTDKTIQNYLGEEIYSELSHQKTNNLHV